MRTITETQIQDILNGTDIDIEPRTYSGRGMYGEECFGITCDGPGADQ